MIQKIKKGYKNILRMILITEQQLFGQNYKKYRKLGHSQKQIRSELMAASSNILLKRPFHTTFVHQPKHILHHHNRCGNVYLKCLELKFRKIV